MRPALKFLFLPVFAGAAASLHAQALSAPVVVGAVPTAPVAPIAFPTVALNLQTSETQRVFTASVANTSALPMTVLGVQTTSGLYVSQFPQAIPAKGSGTFTLLYYAQAGTASTSDFLRVLTDQGVQIVQIDHNRAPAVQFDSTSLQWKLNEAATGKVVNFTVAAGAGTPSGVLALGAGNKAQLFALGNGSFKLTVTPGSTAVPGSFPVIVQFPTAPPDAQLMVTCTVTAN